MKHNKLKYQNLIVNYDARCAEIDGENIGLTHLEFSLLSYLMERKDFAISRQELLREIWELPSAIETRATDDTIKRIRRKLVEHQSHVMIETVRGYGFIIRTK